MKTGFLTLILLVSVSTALSAQPEPQVRAGGECTSSILFDALGRSETLRVLVDAIEQSDVMVYLKMQWNLWRRVASSIAANTNVIDLQKFPNILLPQCAPCAL